MSDWDDDKRLEFDIASALAATPFKVKGQPRDVLKSVARQVVDHLKRCRWRIERKPPPKDYEGAP